MIFYSNLEDKREMNTGIRDFIEEIRSIEGERVNINIKHQLYGNQKIQCDVEIIDDESRLGFSINNQNIYIDKKELCDFGIIKGTYYFASKLMRIELKTI